MSWLDPNLRVCKSTEKHLRILKFTPRRKPAPAKAGGEGAIEGNTADNALVVHQGFVLDSDHNVIYENRVKLSALKRGASETFLDNLLPLDGGGLTRHSALAG
jgi:hypothetical protein